MKQINLLLTFMIVLLFSYCILMIMTEEQTHNNINENYGCDKSTITYGFPESYVVCEGLEKWSEAKQLSWEQAQANVDVVFYCVRFVGLAIIISMFYLYIDYKVSGE